MMIRPHIFDLVVQMAFLNLWMGPGYYTYGLNVLSDVTRHVDWTGTWRFPRITLCDFQIRVLGKSEMNHFRNEQFLGLFCFTAQN